MSFKKIIIILGVLIPLIISGLGYVNHLKSENQRLKLEYINRENTELRETIKLVTYKLDEIYSLVTNHNTLIFRLEDKIVRVEKEQEKLRNRVFGG